MIAVDIPIGLPPQAGRGGRAAENMVRPLEAVRSEAAAKGVAVTEIGTIRAREDPVRVLDQHGKALAFARASFSHF